MYLPDYKDGSIVNLMSSISNALGYKSKYKSLRNLNPKELSKFKNILLLEIDGLGYEYLKENGNNTIFNKYLRDKITSVFPPTTAACTNTFVTGLAPQQHAITGWFMHLKELGVLSAILPFKPRYGSLNFSKNNINPKNIFNQKSIFDKIKIKSYILYHKKVISSDFTIATSGKAKRIYYTSLTNFFGRIKNIILLDNKKKFIYAYWDKLDNLGHTYGIRSKKVNKHFKELNKKITSFLRSINKTNTIMIIIADHGLIDTEKSKIIELKKHPKLIETLTLPLCGEPRLAYCYVHPSKTKQFENYVKKNFKKYCYLYKSEDLIKKNYFGLFKPNKNLFDRVGDYTLIMKENYILKDFVLGEKEHINIGNHGGVSKEEMFVPLIIIKR